MKTPYTASLCTSVDRNWHDLPYMFPTKEEAIDFVRNYGKENTPDGEKCLVVVDNKDTQVEVYRAIIQK